MGEQKNTVGNYLSQSKQQTVDLWFRGSRKYTVDKLAEAISILPKSPRKVQSARTQTKMELRQATRSLDIEATR